MEACIYAFRAYKYCLTVSDNHAVKGMSKLLTDSAATWRQGIKASVNTFDEALQALRHINIIKVFREVYIYICK